MHPTTHDHQTPQQQPLHRGENHAPHDQEPAETAENHRRPETGFVRAVERRLLVAEDEHAQDGEEEEEVACYACFWVGGGGVREKPLGGGGWLKFGFWDEKRMGERYLKGLLGVRRYQGRCRDMRLRR